MVNDFQGRDTMWPSTDRQLPPEILAAITDGAAAADVSGELSESTLDLLRECSYFGLPVPAVLQGGNAGLLECAAVQRRLAMSDPALAIAVNMHLFSVGMAVEHWRRARDACGLILEAIATQQRIVASAFAEPGLGGALLRSNTKARRADRGYIVNGVKVPCSLAAHCDLLCFQMQADAGEPGGLMTAFLPSRASGVRVEQTWDALGMRSSRSDTLRLDECFVPDELVFHRCEPGEDDDEVLAAGLVWFCVATTATYLGVAGASLDAARDELRRSPVSHLAATRAELPSVQDALGEVVAGILAVEAACTAVAARIDTRRDDPRSLVPTALGLKDAGMDACIHAVETAAELVGGAAYARTGLLARLWRDVQAARFHPPTRLVTRRALGKWALGMPFSFELER
jgi:alkylation response protein AidB-like acyl-CoA dehydrogenase